MAKTFPTKVKDLKKETDVIETTAGLLSYWSAFSYLSVATEVPNSSSVFHHLRSCSLFIVHIVYLLFRFSNKGGCYENILLLSFYYNFRHQLQILDLVMKSSYDHTEHCQQVSSSFSLVWYLVGRWRRSFTLIRVTTTQKFWRNIQHMFGLWELG